MSLAEILYMTAQRGLAAAEPLLRASEGKLARGLRARRVAHRVLVEWGRSVRDPGRPTVWFHAPSVGEGLQALAVIEGLLARRPDLQVAFTYFSPSAERLGASADVDVAVCLPWDLTRTVRPVLAALEPRLLVFTRTEVWPVLAREATERSVPLALVAASVRPGAGRLRWPARALLRPTWSRLSLAAAVGGTDAVHLGLLGVPAEAIEVTGDPRVDDAAERARAVDPAAPHVAPFGREPRPTVVAGSTWPTDEDVLLPALSRLRERLPRLRLLLVPHEPDEGRVAALGARLGAAGWSWTTFGRVVSTGTTGGADATVVDTVGRLADLYAIGDVSYVGGGFGRSGLHSVLEPAAAGVPAAFGPRHAAQSAATDLAACGAGAVVRNPAELERALGRWLLDEAARRRAGSRALAYIQANAGAAGRTAALLDRLLSGA